MAVDRDTIYRPGLLPPTAIQDLLRSNEPPGETEIAIITGLITHFRHTVEVLTARMGIRGTTSDQLTELIAERDELDESVQQYTALLSPIRRMPPEIMCEIFSWTLPHTRRVPGSLPIGAPWYLGQISTRWREIALALPSLWSSITVLHAKKHPHKEASPLRIVQTQLTRSASASLHVDFEWEVDGSDAGPFFDALLPHSHRWRSLRLLLGDDIHSHLEYLRAAKGRMFQLSTLEIEAELHGGVPLDVFCIAPRLQEVFLTDPTLNDVSLPLLVPWNQITRYRGVATTEYLVDLLRSATHLVEGVFGCSDEENGLPELDATVIALPRLLHFYVERSDLLDLVATPNLKYLACDTVAPIQPLVERSSCHLTTLVLTECPFTNNLTLLPDDVVSLLQHIPTLKSLVLEASPIHPQSNHRVLSALTVTGSSDICPNLTYLAYGFVADGNVFAHGTLIRMIRSRMHPTHICRLAQLRVLCAPTEDNVEDELDEMQTLADEGLDVEVLHNAFEFIDQARYSFFLS
ncbi:hypothetical protein C8R47DRAFT_1323542 [Mycena vitilis]|nr:hypothetical protein C8R47DRAFT_1323542 [Mycena vitilis]